MPQLFCPHALDRVGDKRSVSLQIADAGKRSDRRHIAFRRATCILPPPGDHTYHPKGPTAWVPSDLG